MNWFRFNVRFIIACSECWDGVDSCIQCIVKVWCWYRHVTGRWCCQGLVLVLQLLKKAMSKALNAKPRLRTLCHLLQRHSSYGTNWAVPSPWNANVIGTDARFLAGMGGVQLVQFSKTICIAQLSRMSHCAPAARKPLRFKFIPETRVGEVQGILH